MQIDFPINKRHYWLLYANALVALFMGIVAVYFYYEEAREFLADGARFNENFIFDFGYAFIALLTWIGPAL
jgi:hypothetical protein